MLYRVYLYSPTPYCAEQAVIIMEGNGYYGRVQYLTSFEIEVSNGYQELVPIELKIESSPGVLHPDMIGFQAYFLSVTGQTLQLDFEDDKWVFRTLNYTQGYRMRSSTVANNPQTGDNFINWFGDCTEENGVLIINNEIRIFPSFFGDSEFGNVYHIDLNGDKGCIFADSMELACQVAQTMDNEKIMAYRALQIGQNCSNCFCDDMCVLWEKIKEDDCGC